MNERSELLQVFSEKEKDLGLFDIKIDGLFVYGFLCRELRSRYLRYHSASADNDTLAIKKKKSIKYTLISFFQLLMLYVRRGAIANFIYSFYRIDKVDSVFVDKFTDPLIDSCTIKNSYIIFEKSNNFEHRKPRAHSKKVIYTDYIEQKAIKYARRNKDKFISAHEPGLKALWDGLDALMGEVNYDKDWAVTRLLRDKCLISFYKDFFLRHKVQRFIAPCRAVFLPQMYVCKEIGIPVFELQHGVNYGMDSITCIGYRNSYFVPDFFLSYGEIEHSERYGIEREKIYNIGWAFFDYIKKSQSVNKGKSNSILVITNNLSINPIFKFVNILAGDFPIIKFDVRLHPLASMTEYAQHVVDNNSNVDICDNTINITVELNRYDMVIGDNSTVLSEALDYEKKVGKIHFEGMVPVYSTEEEKESVWEISDSASFEIFLNSSPKTIRGTKIYSSFNRELFERIVVGKS